MGTSKHVLFLLFYIFLTFAQEPSSLGFHSHQNLLKQMAFPKSLEQCWDNQGCIVRNKRLEISKKWDIKLTSWWFSHQSNFKYIVNGRTRQNLHIYTVWPNSCFRLMEIQFYPLKDKICKLLKYLQLLIQEIIFDFQLVPSKSHSFKNLSHLFLLLTMLD